MNLTPQTVALGLEDQSWLGSARGTNSAQAITLATAAFAAASYYPNGYFPSGTALGLYTSGANAGLYGPLTAGASDGSQILAGFLLTYVEAPINGTTTNVQGALLDNGRVHVAFLPSPSNTAVTAAIQATNPRFVYV